MWSQNGTTDLLSPWSGLQVSCSIDDAQGRIALIFVALATNVCSGYQKSSQGARETSQMLFENWSLPCAPLQTRPQKKHRASTAPSAPHKLTSIPLGSQGHACLSCKPVVLQVISLFFSGGKGGEELRSVPLVQGNAEGGFAQTGVTWMG